MSSEPSKARTRSARSRGRLRQRAVLGGDPPGQQGDRAGAGRLGPAAGRRPGPSAGAGRAPRRRPAAVRGGPGRRAAVPRPPVRCPPARGRPGRRPVRPRCAGRGRGRRSGRPRRRAVPAPRWAPGSAVDPGGFAGQHRVDPADQVGDERGPPGAPGGGAGGQRVGLGEGVQQFEGAAVTRRRRRPPRTVAGSSRSRRVAVSTSSRWWRTRRASSVGVGAVEADAGRPCRGRSPRRPSQWSPGQPLPMSCSRAAISSRSGRSTPAGECGGPDRGLHQVAVDGPAVHGVALRAAAHPLPVRQQPGDQALGLQRLPDRDGGLAGAEQRDQLLAGLGGPGHRAAAGRGGQAADRVRRERQAGLGGRGGGPQRQHRVAFGPGACGPAPPRRPARPRRRPAGCGRPAVRRGGRGRAARSGGGRCGSAAPGRPRAR